MDTLTLESQVIGVPDKTSTPIEPEFKYLEVEVIRHQGTIVILKVPKDFDAPKAFRKPQVLGEACKKTISEHDWDSEGWELDVEWTSIKEIPEKEALRYEIYEIK